MSGHLEKDRGEGQDQVRRRHAVRPPRRRGHPTLTVGGTGDVLAGAIAALLAKGASAFDAACAGTYLVGRAQAASNAEAPLASRAA
ncbi:MAG TPA: NAD(P)H-hydrate dehydratase, partial [Candidatus Thermoplasmatota archaeon]|nr:NAD(P)H-hydrate dehydratase [Candidatus Thermoplasmatota archaeon]